MFKTVALVGVATITGFLATSVASTYEEGKEGETVVEGTIIFKGTPPYPRLFTMGVSARSSFCSQVDYDGFGNRLLREVTVSNSHLQDVIVYIQNIAKGKPFKFNGTDVKIDHCRLLVQGGPSTFVGVVAKGAEFRVLNEDADPSDPLSVDGVLYHPHTYNMISDSSMRTIFSKVLVTKGQMLNYKIKPIALKKSNIMFYEDDSHPYMQAWFYAVENPYYAIVGPNGTYIIDQVPPGKYKLIAWHPILGAQEKEIEVGVTGKVTTNFEFYRSIPKSISHRFTQELVSKLHPGIPEQEIENMFGKPDEIHLSSCGSENTRWLCDILIYIMRDDKGKYWAENRLYLDTRVKPHTLTHWILNFVD